MRTPKFLQKIDKDDICYFESSINYTYLYFQDGKSMISGYNIKVFEALFQNFIKINRSKLINVSYIKKMHVSKKFYVVQLANGDKIPISRRRIPQLKESYPSIF
ncbi:MAG: LytR/AlgR family response regulator transcription factor [Leadbetterella sp.]